jgi:phosphoribosyl-ATP pyrophosphohydrolase/phosphoribosyl-AMP cyclohydrolase
MIGEEDMNLDINIKELLQKIKFDDKGLVPAIAQDIKTKEVLMLAYMNAESIAKTLESGYACYYSRSRQSLWTKGEISGHLQEIKGLYYDCDADTILLKVLQTGPACHTGQYSCFHNLVIGDSNLPEEDILNKLYGIIADRKENPVEKSYTNYLFDKGIDKILKKVGEESAEVIIAAKNNDNQELIYEISDLVYHTMVLMINQGVSIDDIKKELKKRRI